LRPNLSAAKSKRAVPCPDVAFLVQGSKSEWWEDSGSQIAGCAACIAVQTDFIGGFLIPV